MCVCDSFYLPEIILKFDQSGPIRNTATGVDGAVHDLGNVFLLRVTKIPEMRGRVCN